MELSLQKDTSLFPKVVHCIFLTMFFLHTLLISLSLLLRETGLLFLLCWVLWYSKKRHHLNRLETDCKHFQFMVLISTNRPWTMWYYEEKHQLLPSALFSVMPLECTWTTPSFLENKSRTVSTWKCIHLPRKTRFFRQPAGVRGRGQFAFW